MKALLATILPVTPHLPCHTRLWHDHCSEAQWRLLKSMTITKAVPFFDARRVTSRSRLFSFFALQWVCPPGTAPTRPPGGWAGMLWGGPLEQCACGVANQKAGGRHCLPSVAAFQLGWQREACPLLAPSLPIRTPCKFSFSFAYQTSSLL